MSAGSSYPAVDGLRRIVVTGYMGSGKTTVGRLLAVELGWRFADLDSLVEEQRRVSVPQLIASEGEPAFRAAELDALREVLAESRVVIALGGGAPETPGLRSLLMGAPETAVVYLQAPFESLYERCTRQAQDSQAAERPLLGTRQHAQARFDRRLELYEAIATCTVAAHPGTPAEVVRAIKAGLRTQLLGS